MLILCITVLSFGEVGTGGPVPFGLGTRVGSARRGRWFRFVSGVALKSCTIFPSFFPSSSGCAAVVRSLLGSSPSSLGPSREMASPPAVCIVAGVLASIFMKTSSCMACLGTAIPAIFVDATACLCWIVVLSCSSVVWPILVLSSSSVAGGLFPPTTGSGGRLGVIVLSAPGPRPAAVVVVWIVRFLWLVYRVMSFVFVCFCLVVKLRRLPLAIVKLLL